MLVGQPIYRLHFNFYATSTALQPIIYGDHAIIAANK